MAKTFDFKITGRTSASADGTATGLIATKTVEFWDDGTVRFTTASGQPVVIQPTRDLNELWKQIFVGTGGHAATKQWFGCPAVPA